MQTIVIFLAILICILSAVRPFRIGGKTFSFGTVSIVTLALVFLSRVILPETIVNGIVGNGFLEPWKIIVIFFSVAYVSISTDVTGIFDYFALKIVRLANGSSFKLFLFFYLFGGVLTTLTSNDIVILTLTPVIFYVSRHAKINVLPLLFAEFFVANTSSILLFVGNPTNIILGTALDVGFLEFTQRTWLPTIVAVLSNFLLLLVIFRKDLVKKFTLKGNPVPHIRNWFDAWISFGLLILMLFVLLMSDYIGWPIWVITSLFAIVYIALDLFFGVYYAWHQKKCGELQRLKTALVCKRLPKDPHDILIAFRRMPWQILPFIVTMFIFVQRLLETGFIDQLGFYILSFSSHGASLFVAGVTSLVFSNLINNQPTSMLFAYLFSGDGFQALPNVKDFIYPVVFATSLGANITLIGALAGLMWRDILAKKDIHISYMEFFKKGIIITPITFTLTMLTFLFI